MRTFGQPPKARKFTRSAATALLGRARSGQSQELDSMLRLQRTIGNQAVQRLLSAKAPAGTRRKRSVSAPVDRFEQEADRMADHVMRMEECQVTAQRSCAASQEELHLQRNHAHSAPISAGVAPLVHDAAGAPGYPLDSEARRFFETRFPQDLSAARV